MMVSLKAMWGRIFYDGLPDDERFLVRIFYAGQFAVVVYSNERNSAGSVREGDHLPDNLIRR